MRLRLAIVSTVLLGLTPAHAAAQENTDVPASITGVGLLEDCREAAKGSGDRSIDYAKSGQCLAFINGFVQGIIFGEANARRYWPLKATPAADLRHIYCQPEGATLGQFVLVVVKFLSDHPERLHEYQATLVASALQAAFQCPR